jgi:hypothetical protein
MPIPLISSSSARALALVVVASAAIISGNQLTAAPQESTTSAHNPVIQKRVGELAFDPSHPSPVIYQGDELSLRLNFSQPKLGVIVQKKGVPQHEISLPDQMAQVDEILKVSATRALVLGWADGDLSAVAVLEINTGSLGDFFLAYIPTVSPNGSHVAFIKFFPPHGYDDKTGPEDHYMLYDLTRSASQNRPAGIATSR